jgi:predicted alpha/beta-hydrolase family hydrolase
VKSSAKKFERPLVQGWLHTPGNTPSASMVLFHGAGGNCEAPLMVAVAEASCANGYLVFRGNLPFRQQRPKGSPSGNSQRDRDGIRRAVEEIRAIAPGVPLCLAGHSYGGRQSTMLAAEDPVIADVLLLFSYPLHPPGNTAKMRTEHFPSLRIPALFIHGTRDGFGSIEEMDAALKLIPARTKLVSIKGGGHGLRLTQDDILACLADAAQLTREG